MNAQIIDMKNFFIVTAAFEFLTALALLIAPALTTLFLIGSALETPVGIIVARVAGAALFTIAITCLGARNDVQDHAAFGILVAMFFYNVAVVLVLGYSAFTSSLMGVGFFPAVVAHITLAIWSVACLIRTFRTRSSEVNA